MLKNGSLALALAAIALSTASLTVTAGSWPNLPAKKVAQATGTTTPVDRIGNRNATAFGGESVPGDFERVDGESGWALRQHQYVYRGGAFAHAANCPLLASAARAAYPGSANGTPGAAAIESPGA